ncbi:SAM-dependent methyltransferase [Vibrio zhanjiangensis]|uniref:SAM-dependent methyltransferase n=1 Tax=Vibrio zhanjiangensis TaxID=1046128 RepID=A0ABQ6F3J2_9VIBR|nr:methyltransferase [Vibrio zhanjiangensis]GLT19776.1 SAM-dependent methyltransferase [Vibrio zhanjiangensis]
MHAKFLQLDSFLTSHQQFWRFEPFLVTCNGGVPWREDYPQLSSWLASLSDLQIEELKLDSKQLRCQLSEFIPQLISTSAFTQLKPLQLDGLRLDRSLRAGVPGRKLDQIVSMGEAALKCQHGSEWLEWCSGKGYLGRVLADCSRKPVTSFEYQRSLCDSGQRVANQLNLPMTFVQGDALSSSALSVLNPNQHAIALHACGDLHVSLIEKASSVGVPALTISPCCYHLIQDNHYQPLSLSGKLSELKLTQSELRIPLQETVTGGERVKKHRFLEMSYRLGLDLILREVLGRRDYTPIPSVKKSQLSAGFSAFCQWAAELKHLSLPKDLAFDDFYLRGIEHYWQMERFSLVQQPFRRSIEMWLVYDKALYLQEKGYKVSLATFCSEKTTPRNILIQATKP